MPLAPLIAPRLCQTFERAHDGAAVALHEGDQHELLAGLRAGDLSLALTYDLELGADIGFEELAALPPYALLAAAHPLAGRDRVTLAELAAEPLVLLDLPHSRDYFRALFLAEGVDPVAARRSTQPEVIRTLVANGYGFSIINVRPSIDRALDGGELRAVPIAGTPRPMILGIARLARARPTALDEAFAAHCRRAIAAGEVPGLGTEESSTCCGRSSPSRRSPASRTSRWSPISPAGSRRSARVSRCCRARGPTHATCTRCSGPTRPAACCSRPTATWWRSRASPGPATRSR